MRKTNTPGRFHCMYRRSETRTGAVTQACYALHSTFSVFANFQPFKYPPSIALLPTSHALMPGVGLNTPDFPKIQNTPDFPEIQNTPDFPEIQNPPDFLEIHNTPDFPEIQNTLISRKSKTPTHTPDFLEIQNCEVPRIRVPPCLQR